MNNTLIVLGLGVSIENVRTKSLKDNSVSVVNYNEFDRIRGLSFKSISFIGLIPDRVETEWKFSSYLR